MWFREGRLNPIFTNKCLENDKSLVNEIINYWRAHKQVLVELRLEELKIWSEGISKKKS